MRKLLTLFFGAAALLLTLIISTSIAFAGLINSSPVELSKLNQLRPGKNMEQIRERLGEPNRVIDFPRKPGSSWYYSKPLRWYAVRIDFTDTGELIRFAFDD